MRWLVTALCMGAAATAAALLWRDDGLSPFELREAKRRLDAREPRSRAFLRQHMAKGAFEFQTPFSMEDYKPVKRQNGLRR